MNIVFLFSIFLKGIGAILTVLLQIVITKIAGVSMYGNFMAMISSADMIFWVFFSGLVKCNTFYLSDKQSELKKFKRRYYSFYVLPILVVIYIIGIISNKALWGLIIGITCLDLIVYDRSSTLLANGKYYCSLLGEYILGRSILVVIIVWHWKHNSVTIENLLIAYFVQYLFVAFFFILLQGKGNKKDISESVSLRKWGEYQKSDILQTLVGDVPVILQFVASGSFSAGVISIAVLIRKVVSFISGPASKVFLPEFSRLYRLNKRTEICEKFALVMRLQMVFVAPVAVVLIGYPKVVLEILAEELLGYKNSFIFASVIFLIAATLGPCGGLLQMTENEKKENQCRILSIVVMAVTFFILRENSLFALYGLCVQIFIESISKFVCVCIWMKKMPVHWTSLFRWWSVPLLVIVISYIYNWQDSFLMMILTALIVFTIGFVKEALGKRKMK